MGGRGMTQAYRCYLLDLGNRIAAVKVIECRDDRAAKRKAKEVLAALPLYSGAEVWDRGRRVHAVVPDNAPRSKTVARRSA